RIVMQVVIAVEAQRIDKEPVALGVNALQRLGAGRVFPHGRHDDRQLDALMSGDSFQLGLVTANKAGFGDHQNTHDSMSRHSKGRNWILPKSRLSLFGYASAAGRRSPLFCYT